MVEFVSSFVSQAIQTTLNLLFSEASSLTSVTGDIERLRSDHNRIQCFLRDADHHHHHHRDDHHHHRVRNWIAEVKDLSWDVEDLIAEASTAGIFHLRRIRSRIDLLRTKMEDILRSKQAFGIEFGAETSDPQRTLRGSNPHYDDEDEERDLVVGFRDSMEALMSQLTEVEDRLRVVSIVGMGGSGKTTLAKMAYNHSGAKSHFERRAWVCVSQNCSVREVLSQVLVQIDRRKFDTLEEKRDKREVLRRLEERDLVDSVRAELREKRYLLVLDDVWRAQEWDRVRIAFPRGARGSKILLTTRNRQVASLADPAGEPIEPPLLSPEESSELLRRRAFSGEGGGEFPRGFEGPGREMARRCGGLPLGIVALGGLLSTKRSAEEWERVLGDLSSRICGGEVNGILSLSYRDLPYHLKPCFLYLSIFPEDSEIPKRSLVQLWIAEGLIPRPPDREEEEMAETYLEELANRFMIRASKRNSFGIKTYRIHDLTREFCVSKAEEENFSEVIRRRRQDLSSSIIRSRRVAIHSGCDFDTFEVKTRLRSLLCFAAGDGLSSSPSRFRGEGFAMLRSLELGSSRSRVTFAVLKRICKLIHLRYLGLRDTGLHRLPDCLGNLRNLRTLDLRENWEIWIIPAGISNLANLRHLLISALRLNYKTSWTRSAAFRMNNLRYFSLGNHKTWIGFDSLVKLERLQNLRIEFTSVEGVTALIESPVVKSGRLRSLEMEIPSGDTFPNLHSLSRCRNLKSLCLVGGIENDACRFCRRGRKTATWLRYLPPSIAKLTLKHSWIGRRHVAALEKLPNLRVLRLSDEAYSEPELVCSGGGFPKLETLRLCRLAALEEWRVERGAMPRLERLEIEDNSGLRTVPPGLGFIATLRRIDVIDMKKSFGERIRVSGDGIEGEDFDAVRHVSSISFLDTNELHRSDYK